jgi:micrococcal nuclease
MAQRSTKGIKRFTKDLVRFVLLCVFVCLPAAYAQAASLFGKVIEVNSGDVITVFNLNRAVRVKLLGVDAPEMNQEFGDVARKHLFDLLYDKDVLVEYTGIGADKSIAGRVLLNNFDIGAQMIRDGAAWFDPYNGNRLSATDREVYQQSQLAARLEARGLWQTPNPMAPWEFVRSEEQNRQHVSTPDSNLAWFKRRGDEPIPELTNLTLMSTPGGPRRQMTRSEIVDVYRSLNGSRKNLHELRPAGQNFSVLVPEQGRQITQPTNAGGEQVDVNMYLVQEGGSLYSVIWLTGPSLGETDKTALEDSVVEFIKASHKNYERADRGYFSCGKQRETNVSMNGYTGVEYDMSSCSLPTRARAFTKVVDGQREMYIGIVFYGEDDEHVMRFIKSFVAGSAPKAKPRTGR